MIKYFLLRLSIVALIVGSLLSFLVNVSPAAAVTGQLTGGMTSGPDLGIEYPAYSGLRSTDIRITVAQIIRVAMGLLGIVAIGIILYAGFTWMTAGGNEEKVETAKKWISAGVIGLAIILSAYAIASFVVTSLVNATTAVDTTPIPNQ